MKKLLILLLSTISLFSFNLFANGNTEKQSSDDTILVGYTVPDTSESFLSDLTNSVKKLFLADGIKVDIASADGDSAKQISQIENFATAGAKLIIVMPVDPTSIGDALARAQEAGSLVLTAGGDPGVYDAIMYIDQFADGQLMAQMASDWINKTFPNAPEKSVKVAILECRDTPEASARCDGMREIENLNSKVTIANTIGGIKVNDKAQAAMENIIQTTPDINVVLTYNSGGSIGVNEFATRPNSDIKDLSKFATFCSDVDPQILSLLSTSKDNSSVVRGIVKFGSKDLAGDTYNLGLKMIKGDDYEVMNPDPLTSITLENVQEYI